jgi:hypothetical protein
MPLVTHGERTEHGAFPRGYPAAPEAEGRLPELRSPASLLSASNQNGAPSESARNVSNQPPAVRAK